MSSSAHKFPLRCAGALATLAAWLLASPALALQPTPAQPGAAPPAASGQAAPAPAPAPASAPAPAPASPASAPAPTTPPDAAAAPAADAAPTFLERMPSSAFPPDKLRGLHGGSLWSSFTDLQWPYYPKTGIGVSGYAWIDSGYEHIARGNPSEQGTKYWLQQGRFVLRVTPTWSDGNYFVQAQAELVANKDQSQAQPFSADTDDIWIKAGQWKKWDVQLGRYEGWEVYHFGMGLDLYTLERNGATDASGGFTVPQIYGVTYAFYRPAGVGQAALHLYPFDFFRFELGTQFGNELGSNTLAVRPVGVLDFGPPPTQMGTTTRLRFKLGAEYKNLTDQTENAKDFTNERGVGGSVQVIVDPLFEAGVNGAYGMVDHNATDGTVDEAGSFTTFSVGGFANARIVEDLMAGAGFDYTYLEDIHFDQATGRNQRFKHTQTFVALQYVIAKQLYVKLIGAYAKGDFEPNFGGPIFSNEMLSGRLRVQYLF
jgi:hypothetical protein